MKEFERWEKQSNPDCEDKSRTCDDNIKCSACERREGWRAALEELLKQEKMLGSNWAINWAKKELEVTPSET